MATASIGSEASTIILSKKNGAAWLTLNRPHALNATNEHMHRELADALVDVATDGAINALVITGAGDRAFCIGSDIGFLNEAFGQDGEPRLDVFHEYLKRLNGLFFAIEQLPVPTIAMVNGRARAGGFELILACDLVLIADEALIGDVHTPFGHMPGGGATQRLARKIGIQRALELIYTGKWLTGPQAVDYGLALASVPRAGLKSVTDELLSQLTDKKRDSLMYVKRATYQGLDLSLREGVALEINSYLEYLQTSPEPISEFRQRQAARSGQPSPPS